MLDIAVSVQITDRPLLRSFESRLLALNHESSPVMMRPVVMAKRIIKESPTYRPRSCQGCPIKCLCSTYGKEAFQSQAHVLVRLLITFSSNGFRQTPGPPLVVHTYSWPY